MCKAKESETIGTVSSERGRATSGNFLAEQDLLYHRKYLSISGPQPSGADNLATICARLARD